MWRSERAFKRLSGRAHVFRPRGTRVLAARARPGVTCPRLAAGTSGPGVGGGADRHVGEWRRFSLSSIRFAWLGIGQAGWSKSKTTVQRLRLETCGTVSRAGNGEETVAPTNLENVVCGSVRASVYNHLHFVRPGLQGSDSSCRYRRCLMIESDMWFRRPGVATGGPLLLCQTRLPLFYG